MGQHLPQDPLPALRLTGAREVLRVVPAVRTVEGGGFIVHRPFPKHGLLQVDPFLLLDEMGPVDNGPGEAIGAPDHPHRGFETVTYLLSGEMEHKDSRGHHGTLGPGDVQWMTAGDGVIHSEMPTASFQKNGGRMHGFQLWVNLPAVDKRMRPRYQDKKASELPVATSADGKVWVRVVAGEALGIRAAIDTRTPIVYLHLKLQPGARHVQKLAPEMNAFAYVVSGQGLFGSGRTPGKTHDMPLFAPGGDEVSVENASDTETLELLLIAGQPLGEPMARYGPFVMNTREEILEAVADLQAGKFGSIAPDLG